MTTEQEEAVATWKLKFSEHIHKEYDPNVKDFFVTLDHMLELVEKFK